MTNRQRFHETMNFGNPDRVPYLEEGIRKDVIKSWYRQGLPRKTPISDLFTTDQSDEIDLEFDPLSTLSKQPTSLKELAFLRNRLKTEYPTHFASKQKEIIDKWQKQDSIRLLKVHPGFFLTLGVHKWDRFTEVISLTLDDPEFIREAMHLQAELIVRFLDKVPKEIAIDAVIFSEPIGGNEGPLISPAMYEQFVLKSYKPILDVVKKRGVKTIILRSYANIRLLIPGILNSGFNCLWACETSSAMDYRDLRKEFGRDLRLIGGIDLDVLRKDRTTIQQEIKEKVPPLIASGGYIPLADGRVRKDIPFENYLYYREVLKSVIGTT